MLLPTKIHIRIINEATGVDFITVINGYRISYNMSEKEHKSAIKDPKIIAITIPSPTLPKE